MVGVCVGEGVAFDNTGAEEDYGVQEEDGEYESCYPWGCDSGQHWFSGVWV